MMKEIKDYKERLEKAICEYMAMPVTERSSEAVRAMMKTYKKACEMECKAWNEPLTEDNMHSWNAYMMNADGTKGGHWTMEQTTAVAESIGLEFEHITPCMWHTTMNMMYSDYGEVATKYGIGTAEFFADMAKAFLFDKDGGEPKEKLSAYYHCIVNKD